MPGSEMTLIETKEYLEEQRNRLLQLQSDRMRKWAQLKREEQFYCNLLGLAPEYFDLNRMPPENQVLTVEKRITQLSREKVHLFSMLYLIFCLYCLHV